MGIVRSIATRFCVVTREKLPSKFGFSTKVGICLVEAEGGKWGILLGLGLDRVSAHDHRSFSTNSHKMLLQKPEAIPRFYFTPLHSSSSATYSFSASSDYHMCF